ncbi:hypothetical protein [Reyranella sp.]|uniref:hypothetical protein n=1 Tax=Reyranella sp. TaxID=1929291 RepID=UPI00272F4616|nr:hypothetical protein [Reyranella sp.]MDP2377792.1 hypothetical protein [Reyranella sp.]
MVTRLTSGDMRRRHRDGDKAGDVIIAPYAGLRPNMMYGYGQELFISQQPEVYDRYGDDHGTTNSPLTFRMPDFRGVALFGVDNMGGRAAYRVVPIGSGATPGIKPYRVGGSYGMDRRYYRIEELPPGMLKLLAGTGLVLSDAKVGAGAALYETSGQAPYPMLPPCTFVNFAIIMGRDVVIIPPVPEPGEGVTDEEFNGPFADWTLIDRDYGIVPNDDVAVDITAALQLMINDCTGQGVEGTREQGREIGSNADESTHYNSRVAYLPRGRYKITDTIRLGDSRVEQKANGALGIALVGEDPRNTIIEWDGVTDGSGQMFWSAGMHDGIISRITLDGKGVADIGLRIERDPDVPINQSYNRFEFCFFKDMKRGVAGTTDIAGEGTDSEMSFFGCRFYRCSEFGISTVAAESYDWWVRCCYFEECTVGVGQPIQQGMLDYTTPLADFALYVGAFSIYDCTFNGSTEWDIHGINGETVSVRGCVSKNSARFIKANGMHGSICWNRIIDPVNTDCIHTISQMFGSGGSSRKHMSIYENDFHLREGATGPVYVDLYNVALDYIYNFKYAGVSPSNYGDPRFLNTGLILINNRFNVDYENPDDLYSTDPRWDFFEMGTLLEQTIDDELPLKVPVPAVVERAVFYLHNGNIMQSQIAAAEAEVDGDPDAYPVVYLPNMVDTTRLILDATLIFPAGKRMSFQGGGYGSIFHRYDIGIDEPAVLFRGPSLVHAKWVRSKGLAEGGKAGIDWLVDNCAQAGARVVMDNCYGRFEYTSSHLKLDVTDHYWNSNSYESMKCRVAADGTTPGEGRVLIEAAATGLSADDKGFRFRREDVADGKIGFIPDYAAGDLIVGTRVRYWYGGGATATPGLVLDAYYYIVSITDGTKAELSETEGGAPIAVTPPAEVGPPDHYFYLPYDSRAVPVLIVSNGGRAFVKDFWFDSELTNHLLFVAEGVNAGRRGTLGLEASRAGMGGVRYWDSIQVLEANGFKGDLIVMGQCFPGRMIANGSVADLTCMSFDGPTFLDDDGALSQYEGQDVTFLGFVRPLEADVGEAYDPEKAGFSQLPGWPDAYGGDDYDAYITQDTGHLWVWKDGIWNEWIGVVGTASTKTALPGYPDSYESGITGERRWLYNRDTGAFYAGGDDLYTNGWNTPKPFDAYITLDDLKVHYWDGDEEEWVTLSGSLMPDENWWYLAGQLPSHPDVGGNITGGQERYRWFSKPPMGIGGTMPTDHEAIMGQLMNARATRIHNVIAEGLTDARFRVVKADLVFRDDVYVAP